MTSTISILHETFTLDINTKISYSIGSKEIDDFLKLSPDKRISSAPKFIANIMTSNGKSELYGAISELLRIEDGTRTLNETGRDHVSHAILSFILGIIINEALFADLSAHVDAFQWKIAGLFHDVGYPLEITNKIAKSFNNNIVKICNEYDMENFNLDAKIQFISPILSNGQDSLLVIQERVGRWNLDIDIVNEFKSRMEKGEICHGIISSLVLLKLLDGIYSRYNPNRKYTYIKGPKNTDVNQRYFDEDIVSACAAIFLHNFKQLNRKIKLKDAPLAFLLKLSDSMQDWERLAKDKEGNEFMSSSDQYGLRIAKNKLCLIIREDSENRKESIKGELESCLDVNCSIECDELNIEIN